MRLADIAVWTVATVVGLITYICVAMAAWVIWPPSGEAMFLVLVLLPFTPELWMLLWTLRKRRRERQQTRQI